LKSTKQIIEVEKTTI